MTPSREGGIGRRLRAIEREAEAFYRELRLEDGTTIRYPPGEELAALSAAIDDEDHWLLPHIRQVPPGEGPFPSDLIRAIDESRKKIAEEKGEGEE